MRPTMRKPIQLNLFDETVLYCINIHTSRTRKTTYIKGFRNSRQSDINKQLLFFVNELKNTKGSRVEKMKKECDLKQTLYTHFKYDNSIKGFMVWLPERVLQYINSIDESGPNFVMECEYDPKYFDNVKDGITNKQYCFLFGDVERYIYYDLPFTDSP